MLLEWSTSIDSRDFVHILCKQLSCTSPLSSSSSPSCTLSALMLLKAKQNTGYGCKECWFFGMSPWILLPVASHGKRVQPPVSVAGWSPQTGQKEEIAMYPCCSLFFLIHYSQVFDHPQFATGIDPALLTY